MKLPAVIILFLLPLCSSGQQWSIDSLKFSKVQATIDSVNRLTFHQWNKDSLKILLWSSSLRSTIVEKFTSDSLSVVAKLDSVRSMNLTGDFIQIKLNSITQKKDSLLNEVRSKQQDLLKKTRGQLDEWRTKVKDKLKINSVLNVDGADVPHTSLPDVNALIPDNQITNLSFNNVNVPELDIPQIPVFDMGAMENINLSADLVSLNESYSLEDFNRFGGIQDRVSDVTRNYSNISVVATNPSQTLEQSFTQIKEVKEVTVQLQQVEEFKQNELMQKADMLKDPESMKAELKKEVVQRAVNHFVGKEQVLQQAMDNVAKYKKKFESLNNLEDVKHLRKNSMRGRPFAERFVTGIAFQFVRNDDLFLDFNPYAGYRITERFAAGIGWNQRIRYSGKKYQFTSLSVIYGPRLFSELKIWKGFSSRFEVEWMNTTIRNMINSVVVDPEDHAWVCTPLMGIKKEQEIFKSLKGTILLMFNLYNPLHKSPYEDLIYSRIGFEFALKKTKN
jgi:hypothetical protein